MNNRGNILLDPFFRETDSDYWGLTGLDPMRWFRLEEEMLLLGLGERVAAEIVREAMQPELWIEMRFLHAKWSKEAR